MFKVGDLAVYPAHGVGEVTKMETRNIGGQPVEFYVIRICSSGATLMVPAGEAVARAGMRPLASAATIDTVLKTLRTPVKVEPAAWNRRFREYHDMLRNDSLVETAKVLRAMHDMSLGGDLSYGERKMYDKAMSMILEEVCRVTGRSKAEVTVQLVEALKGGDL